jgi:hypothetical protein
MKKPPLAVAGGGFAVRDKKNVFHVRFLHFSLAAQHVHGQSVSHGLSRHISPLSRKNTSSS